MTRFRSFLHHWSYLFLIIGILSQLVVGSTTLLNVICRFSGIAMTGYIELIEVIMIALGMGALGIAAFEKTQVAIDVVINLFSADRQIIFKIFSAVVNLVFWISTAWVTMKWVFAESLFEQTDILKIPVGPFYLYWGLGLVLLCLVFTLDLLDIINERRKQ